MAFLSVFQGYWTINVLKAYGWTKPALMDDAYLTQVGSIAAFMGALRFLWSGAMDLDSASFKKVYGTLLILQVFLGLTIELATTSRFRFAIWMCAMVFTEGGHFTIVPNALKTIYGNSAGVIYGVIFTFTGLANILILSVVRSDFANNYDKVYILSSCLSFVALVILVFGFREERLFIR